LIKKDAINDDMIYIGSTEDIKDRMRHHKIRCNNIKHSKYNYKVYKYIRDNGGWDEWKYEIIDEVEVALREDAGIYEGEYIIKYNAIKKLNVGVAGRCLNKSKKQYHKEWREQNKDDIKQKKKKNISKIRRYFHKNKNNIISKIKMLLMKDAEKIEDWLN